MIAVIGCNSTSETTKEDQLLKEVVRIHDDSMKDFGLLMRLKRQLKSSMDSSRLDEYNQAIEALEDSHEEMMEWMRAFTAHFPDAGLDHAGHTPSDGHHMKDDHHNAVKSDDMLQLLEIEKEQVLKLSSQTQRAIEEARALLQNPD